MNKYISLYIEEMTNRNLSENTLQAYTRDLNKFYGFTNNKNLLLTEVDNYVILSYIRYLKNSKKANNTVTRNIICLRNFYKFLYLKGFIEKNPVESYDYTKVQREIPEFLTIEEVDCLLNQPDLNTYKGIRDKAILELLYATGIKVSELITLQIKDINIKLNYILCKGSKGKERIIPIGGQCVECLKNYLLIRDNFIQYETDILFLNLRGNQMTRQGFWKIIKQYAKTSNIKKTINLNTLRHSFAVHLIQNGADVKSIQELLGYSSVEAVSIYTTITKKTKIAEIYQKAHPRA